MASIRRARLAALGHDLVRHLKGNELLALAARYEIVLDAVELASPILTHGPIAARILALDYGIDDTEVLDGIDCHTTARAGMTALEKCSLSPTRSMATRSSARPSWLKCATSRFEPRSGRAAIPRLQSGGGGA